MAFQTCLIKVLYNKSYYKIKKKTSTDNIIFTNNLKINKSKTYYNRYRHIYNTIMLGIKNCLSQQLYLFENVIISFFLNYHR